MKKKKNKIVILILLIIILIILTILLIQRLLFKNDKNIFNSLNNYKEENYNLYVSYYEKNNDLDKEEIVNFINYCSQSNIDCVNSYDKLIEYYTLDDFKLENLDKYVNFKNKYSTIENSNIIKLINNDLEAYIENSNTDQSLKDENNKDYIVNFLLNLINEKYYKKDNLERYVNYYSKNNNLTSKEIVTNVNSNLDTPFYENYESTDTSKDTLMIVNKHYKIENNYKPDNLVTVLSEHGYPNKIRADVYEEFKKMYNAAKNDNVSIFIASPYRSYSDQNALYTYYVNTDGKQNADTYSARPGFSEHHTGLAMDLIPEYGLDLDTFENSDGFKWMQENAYKYGFILRYPKDKEDITGYSYESWHYRYVGVEIASFIKENNLTLDEYYVRYIEK
mgnify:CR=1 FL=1